MSGSVDLWSKPLVCRLSVALLLVAIAASFFYRQVNSGWVSLHAAEKVMRSGNNQQASAIIRSIDFDRVWMGADRLRLRAAEMALFLRDVELADDIMTQFIGPGFVHDLISIRIAAGIADGRQQTDEAIRLYSNFQEKGGRLDDAGRLHLADLYRTLRSYGKAEELYREVAFSSRSQGDRGRLHLAEMLSWQQRWEEALQLFREVLARNPDERQARLGLARTLDWMGKHDEAVGEYRKLLGAP